MLTIDAKTGAISDGVQLLNPLAIADWDVKLASFPTATFFHTAAWARVLHDTYGYRPIYFAAHDSNGITSVLPFMEIDSWLTGKRGVSLPFTDECEPLGAEFVPLFQKAQNHAIKNGWKYLECRGGRSALDRAPASKSYFSHRLQLGTDETALFAKFESSVRRAVRKAEQNKLTIEFSQSPASIRDFYELFCKTRQRHGVPPQPFAFFANIQRHVLAQNQGWIVLARQGQEVVAGAVFFHFGKSVIYKFGASNEAFQHLRANNLVMWEAIRRYAREGFTCLDFGRTALKNEGLRRFKLGWGTQERQIDYVTYSPRKSQFAEAREERSQWLSSVYKFMPVFLSKAVGFMLYKHIAGFTLLFNWNLLDYCS